MKMNWIDRAIQYVAPRVSLERTKARRMHDVLLAYDGARTGRRAGGWTTTGSSGNSEIGLGNSAIRQNARDLVRNNAFARKAVNRRAKRVVGYGITPQAATGKANMDAVINAAWEKWSKRCCSDRRYNFAGVMEQIVRTEFVCGEVLIRKYSRRPGDGIDVPFQIQVMEPDFLDASKNTSLDGGAYIIQGVQFDVIGRITGYWLFPQHPGEVVITSAKNFQSAFVPAEYVIHHLVPDRPGDVRAVSRFAPVIAKLADLREYTDAEIVRKKMAACMVGSVTQPEGANGDTIGSVVTDSEGQRVESFSPGMMLYSSPGAETSFFSPSDSGDYSAYKKTELREIAAGLDVPYIVLNEDLSDVNYSSFRGGAIDERDGIEQYRWNWLVPQVLDSIWETFIDTLFLVGAIPEKNYGVKWNPPAFDLLDRKEEAEADMREMQIGKKTWPQMVGDQGNDPESQITQIETWKDRLNKAGVTFLTNPQGVANDAKATAAEA